MKFGTDTIYDKDGNEIFVNDTRIFSDCVANQLKFIREHAATLILDGAPEYKQRNAALGLLSQQEIDDMKNHIQTIRNQSNALEKSTPFKTVLGYISEPHKSSGILNYQALNKSISAGAAMITVSARLSRSFINVVFRCKTVKLNKSISS